MTIVYRKRYIPHFTPTAPQIYKPVESMRSYNPLMTSTLA
jgi:hypothetical protein